MGSLLHNCRAVSLRALVVSALLALAWLVWGAGSAQASTAPSEGTVSEAALDVNLSPAVSAAPQTVKPVISTVSKAAAPVVSADSQATAPAVSTATRTAPQVVSIAPHATAPVVSTAEQTVAAVVSTVEQTVAAVDHAVASVAKRLPLPAVKLPQLRNAGVPAAATAPKTLPTVEFAVPAVSVPEARPPVAKTSSGAVPTRAPAAALAGTASTASTTADLPAAQNVDAARNTLAQLRTTASARPLVSANQAPPSGLWNGHPATEPLNVAATQGQSASTGSTSPGSHAADIAAAWDGPPAAATDLVASASVTPPSGPAPDPGSSPD